MAGSRVPGSRVPTCVVPHLGTGGTNPDNSLRLERHLDLLLFAATLPLPGDRPMESPLRSWILRLPALASEPALVRPSPQNRQETYLCNASPQFELVPHGRCAPVRLRRRNTSIPRSTAPAPRCRLFEKAICAWRRALGSGARPDFSSTDDIRTGRGKFLKDGKVRLGPGPTPHVPALRHRGTRTSPLIPAWRKASSLDVRGMPELNPLQVKTCTAIVPANS